jgi:hypothetical protein
MLKRDKDLPGYAIGGISGGEDKVSSISFDCHHFIFIL